MSALKHCPVLRTHDKAEIHRRRVSDCEGRLRMRTFFRGQVRKKEILAKGLRDHLERTRCEGREPEEDEGRVAGELEAAPRVLQDARKEARLRRGQEVQDDSREIVRMRNRRCHSGKSGGVRVSGFETFRHSPVLETMLTFAGWQHGFTASDKKAMEEGLQTIRTAMIQPVGLARPGIGSSKDKRYVTDAEFDRAVMTVLASSMALWLSGGLNRVEVDE